MITQCVLHTTYRYSEDGNLEIGTWFKFVIWFPSIDQMTALMYGVLTGTLLNCTEFLHALRAKSNYQSSNKQISSIIDELKSQSKFTHNFLLKISQKRSKSSDNIW